MHLQHAHKLSCMDHTPICLKAGACGRCVVESLAFALSMAANEM